MHSLRKNISLSLTKPVFLLVFFILTTFACRCQSNNPEGASATEKGKSKPETGLQDTLGSIKGKIVDSVTNEPVPFVKITIYNDSGSMAIMSNAKGEFYITSKHLKSNILLSSIGYQDHTYRLIASQTNVFHLTPKSNLLPGVTVSTQMEKNAGRIMKRVDKNMEKNYGSPSFDQSFRTYALTRNYDTVKGEITHLFKQHFYGDQTTMLTKTVMVHSDTANYDAFFFNLIGVPVLSFEWVIHLHDILRKGLVIGKKSGEYFDFKLLGRYQDKQYGSVYRISFKPRSPYYVFSKGANTADMWWGLWRYFNGEMLVSENDYAVVNVKYTQELEVDSMKKSVEYDYHSPYWKADRVSKIVPNSLTFNDEYSYIKDTSTGKYFVQAIMLDYNETGYQVENNQSVQLYFQFDINSLGIENVGIGAN